VVFLAKTAYTISVLSAKNTKTNVSVILRGFDKYMDTLKAAPLPPPLVMKKFEICFDKEPTQSEISCLQQEAAGWSNHRVIKVYPAKFNTEKVAKFWTLSFDVEEKDWMFWCGFLAGKKWRLKVSERDIAAKERDKKVAEYMVQI